MSEVSCQKLVAVLPNSNFKLLNKWRHFLCRSSSHLTNNHVMANGLGEKP